MELLKTKLDGVFILEPKKFGDYRGYFMETYNTKTFEALGITAKFVQDNESFTAKKGTIRGLHFQNNPMAQAKLVRVVQGAVMDVAVDIRKGSATYLQWEAVELTAENGRMLYLPRGFAHGFLTLTDNVKFIYKVDQLYSPLHDRSIRFDDAKIGVIWGVDAPILSEKDRNAPTLENSDCNFTVGGV